MKIFVAIPSHDNVPVGWAFDMAKMYAFTVAAMPGDVEIGLNLCPGTYIQNARQQLAIEAVKAGATHILWLDSDMRFPRDLMVRLLQHRKDFVGINYSTRGVDSRFVAIKSTGLDDGGEPSKVQTLEHSTGLEEAEAIGFGACLMRIEVVESVLDDLPLFTNLWDDEKKRWIGEDVYFCRKVRERGVKIWVDHDLSKECAHVGQFEYKCAHAEAMLEVAA